MEIVKYRIYDQVERAGQQSQKAVCDTIDNSTSVTILLTAPTSLKIIE